MKFELSERDRAVVQIVGKLSQLSTAHIKALIFNDVNRISMDRSLKRLRDEKLIRKVGVRSTGHRGGTPPSVYILGPKGWWYLRRHGEYPSITAVREHTLHIADIFVQLIELERTGLIKVLPDTDVEHVVGNMRVDMNIDIAIPALGEERMWYVEAQHHARADLIKQKLVAHWDTYSTYIGDSYPSVAFVCRDEYIAYRIRRLIPQHMQRLFTVDTHEEFIDRLTRS